MMKAYIVRDKGGFPVLIEEKPSNEECRGLRVDEVEFCEDEQKTDWPVCAAAPSIPVLASCGDEYRLFSSNDALIEENSKVVDDDKKFRACGTFARFKSWSMYKESQQTSKRESI